MEWATESLFRREKKKWPKGMNNVYLFLSIFIEMNMSKWLLLLDEFQMVARKTWLLVKPTVCTLACIFHLARLIYQPNQSPVCEKKVIKWIEKWIFFLYFLHSNCNFNWYRSHFIATQSKVWQKKKCFFIKTKKPWQLLLDEESNAVRPFSFTS